MAVNMSYCRFQNTLKAMRECAEALYDGGNDPLADLSEEEREAAKALLELSGELSDCYGPKYLDQ